MIERRETGYYIVGSRVPIDGIVFNFRLGYSPEKTQEMYPTLTLEQVTDALKFYLINRDDVDGVVEERYHLEELDRAANLPDIGTRARMEAAWRQEGGSYGDEDEEEA